MSNPGVSLNYDTQLAALQRRQKLAEMLQTQAAEPTQTYSYNGIQAPVSPMSGLAKALKGFAGAYYSGKATDDQAALKQKEIADALTKMGTLNQLPDTTKLVNSSPDATGTPSQWTIPNPMGGDGANLSVPTVGRTQGTQTVPGGPRPYDDQRKMLNEWALGENPLLAQQVPGLMAQIKPQYVAGSEYGTNKINPDGTIEQVIDPVEKKVARYRPATAKDLVGYPSGTAAQVNLDTNELANIKTPDEGRTQVQVNLPNEGGGAYAKKVGELNATSQDAAITAARDAPAAIATAQRVKRVLGDPSVITGTGADIKLGLTKALYGPTASAAQTEELVSGLAKTTLGAIKSSGLGAGQGFTDNDLKFLSSATAGTLTYTKPQLMRLADIAERVARAGIKRGNDVLEYQHKDPDLAKAGVMYNPIPMPPEFSFGPPPPGAVKPLGGQ